MNFKPTDEEIRIDVEEELKASISSDYVYEILDFIADEVIEDIRTSADVECYSNSDIRFALGRVILKKLTKLDEVEHFCHDLQDNHSDSSVEYNLAKNILNIIS